MSTRNTVVASLPTLFPVRKVRDAVLTVVFTAAAIAAVTIGGAPLVLLAKVVLAIARCDGKGRGNDGHAPRWCSPKNGDAATSALLALPTRTLPARV